MLPAQVLGELFNVLTRKAGRSAAQARDAVLSWSDAFDVADSTRDAVTAACDLEAAHQLQFWDALIVSVAVRQQCRVLLTEDLNEGFVLARDDCGQSVCGEGASVVGSGVGGVSAISPTANSPYLLCWSNTIEAHSPSEG